ncbi:MAG TPA: c-type cytochrome [Steroidobacteraceae bacterium]|nr:c-type cytochrome [Steroidobacteraceae bacterium]
MGFFTRIAQLALFALTLLGAATVVAAPARVDQLVRRALQLDANASRGAALYLQNCARCHGQGAIGDARNVVPALAAQREAYLIKQLADFAELERESSEMHAVIARAAVNEPQAWADLAAYLARLPATEFPETADGEGVELGEAIFQEQCASCHEEDARGDDDGFVPSLRDQHYSYLVRQTRALAASHRLNVDPDLVRFIDSLDTDEMTAVADYLSRLRGPVRDRSKLRDDGKLRD